MSNDEKKSVLDSTEAETIIPARDDEHIAKPIEKDSFVKMLNRPENKNLKNLIRIVGVMIFVAIAVSIGRLYLQETPEKRNDQSTVTKTSLPEGRLSPQQKDALKDYNEKLGDKRKDDPLAQPIAMENSNDAQDKLSELDKDCASSDTACMRLQGKIKEDECAPDDSACKSELAKRAKEQEKAAAEAKSASAPTKDSRLDDKDYLSKMASILDKDVERNKPQEVGFNVEFKEEKQVSKSSDAGAAKEGLGIVKQTVKQEIRLQNSGDQLYAASDIALNSDISGPVKITILDGKYPNSVMTGQAEKVDEYMRLNLTKWILPDGAECKISAIALDRKTTYAAIQSRVDYHLLYRYGWWGVGTVLSAVGKASEKNADKQLIVNANGVAIETTKSDTNREIKMAVGELGQEIGSVMKSRISRPETVFVDHNEEMGVFFMDQVLDSQCK